MTEEIKKIQVIIDDKEIDVPEGVTVLQACEIAEQEIPVFCYHSKLSIAGNCRMCLVQVAVSYTHLTLPTIYSV